MVGFSVPYLYESDVMGIGISVVIIGVLDNLEKASGESRQPEFMSTHPSSDNRRDEIRRAIEKYSNPSN